MKLLKLLIRIVRASALATVASVIAMPAGALMTQWVVFPIGYHEIKLPEGSIATGWNIHYWGMGYQIRVWPDTSKEQFEKIVVKDTAVKSEEVIEKIMLEDSEIRVLFRKDSRVSSGQVAECYFLDGSTMFQLLRPCEAGEQGQASAMKEIRTLAQRLHPRGFNEVPKVQGLCFDNAFMVGLPEPKDIRGKIAVAFRFPKYPDIKVCMFIQMNRAGDMPETQEAYNPGSISKAVPSQIVPLKGEESQDENPTKNKGTDYFFNWTYQGKAISLECPRITLTMEAGSKEKGSVLPKKDLVEIWKRMISSIQVRPSLPDLRTPAGGTFPLDAAQPSNSLSPREGPACPCSKQFSLFDPLGQPVPNRFYTILDEGGEVLAEGRSDAKGDTEEAISEFPGEVRIEIKP